MLGELYKDFFDLFPEMDMFHMGGDEVNLNCWNSSQEIREYLTANGQTGTEEELVQLWNLFQVRSFPRLYLFQVRYLL
jgi:hexosaminidase